MEPYGVGIAGFSESFEVGGYFGILYHSKLQWLKNYRNILAE